MRIYLVGPTGVGKTTVGRLLASRLSMAFLDADELVAARAGMSVRAIFTREGEAGFRRREKEAVALLTHLGKCVAALGGGAVLDAEIREWLVRTGRVVPLVADPALLVERLRACPRAGLPHPSEAGFVDRAREAFSRRMAAAAGLGPSLDVTSLSPEQAVDRLLDLLGISPPAPPAPPMPPGPGQPPARGTPAVPPPSPWRLEVRAGGVTCLVRGDRGEVRTGTLELPRLEPPSALLVVSSPLPYCLYGRTLVEQWRARGLPAHVTLVPDGEEAKQVRWLERLWRAWARLRVDREALVVAIGGGAVSDLAGFTAATYLRGIPWVVVPTTLLAQVDASLGGKVAIDLPQGKNLAGAFWQPRSIHVDVEVLASLPDAQVSSGMAEVVKCALLEGEDFLGLLEARVPALLDCDPGATGEVVRRCLSLKARLVEEDERERGPRQLLNLGHTVGHALEREAGWDHGRAVAVGLLAACRLADAKELADRVRTLLEKLGLPVGIPPGLAGRVAGRMAWDKKARHGELRFVLPEAPGRVKWGVPVEPGRVGEVLRSLEG
ncbi:MAG: bifunctional shikimate kinase/3-dehydroquinate synthase [Bacillota bacterium]|nr:bifunctional shikimate kinase/3-dehydroquinate synthase [Bacillota bacterium]MDI7248628.1 bifunctional shikimate kinase/3-dehydroquinate synthase [Bacillota bacterium]